MANPRHVLRAYGGLHTSYDEENTESLSPETVTLREEQKKEYFALVKVYEFLRSIQRSEYRVHIAILNILLEEAYSNIRKLLSEEEIIELREEALQSSKTLSVESSVVKTVLKRAEVPIGIFKRDMRDIADMFPTTAKTSNR